MTIEFWGGPKDGELRAWDDPYAPPVELRFPVASDLRFRPVDDPEPLSFRTMTYRRTGLLATEAGFVRPPVFRYEYVAG